MGTLEEAKLELLIQWLQLNGVELRGCEIKWCGSDRGFGVFLSNDVPDGVLLVVPLDLAITPMRVLQDPILGPECNVLFDEGQVDDRFLMTLFLTIERLRSNSSWKPYIDVLPTSFGNPLWFTDDDLLELKGTTLYQASQLQKQKLRALYDEKVKKLVTKVLDLNGDAEREVCFKDFLWANSIFWTRAMSIPFPRSYVFPHVQDEKEKICPILKGNPGGSTGDNSVEELARGKGILGQGMGREVHGARSVPEQTETLWVEGLVPGIDFCNHDLKPAATWEVDGTGLTTGVPASMYLLSAGQSGPRIGKEISISYGNKGNEELLYLYGFVIDSNPDDYLMVHYPVEAIQGIPFSDSKVQLLEAQKSEMRCLLPRNLLDQGFFSVCTRGREGNDHSTASRVSTYSWCGQRKMPSYLSKLIFPEDFLTSLRTIAMQENELYEVSELLQELVGSDGERQPSDSEVRAAIWEACGDCGALQLLVDLLNTKMLNLEEGSGTEENDMELLRTENLEEHASSETEELIKPKVMSRNRRSSILYRKGQKELARLFLKEAEHALHLALSEEN